MTKTYTLNLIFITQYIYQLQNRLYTFEKKNKYKMTETIESILLDSWGSTKLYLFNKKIKKNNIDFQYLTLLKHTKNSSFNRNAQHLHYDGNIYFNKDGSAYTYDSKFEVLSLPLRSEHFHYDISTYLLDKNVIIDTYYLKGVDFIIYDSGVHRKKINQNFIYINSIQYLLIKQLFLKLKITDDTTYLLDKDFSFNVNAEHNVNAQHLHQSSRQLNSQYNIQNNNDNDNFSLNKNVEHFYYDGSAQTYNSNPKNSTVYGSNVDSNYNRAVENKFHSTKKSLYLFYKSTFFLIQFRLIRSLLISLVIHNNKKQLSYSIMKNYSKLAYFHFERVETKFKEFTFKRFNKMIENDSAYKSKSVSAQYLPDIEEDPNLNVNAVDWHYDGSAYVSKDVSAYIYNSKFHSAQYLSDIEQNDAYYRKSLYLRYFYYKVTAYESEAVLVTTVTKKYRFLNKFIYVFDDTKKLLYLNNMNKIINFNKAYLVDLDKFVICSMKYGTYPEQIFKIMFRVTLTNKTIRINLSKILSGIGAYLPTRTIGLTQVSTGTNGCLAVNQLTVDPKKITSMSETLSKAFNSAPTSNLGWTDFFLLEKLVSISKTNKLIKFRPYYLKNFYKFYYFFFQSKKINNRNFQNLNMQFKEKKMLCSFDKKLFILKLTDFLIYLLLLKPRWVHNLSEQKHGPNNTYSRHGAINFVIKNLKVKSQYFVHVMIHDSYNYVVSKPEGISYLNFNSLTLKTLLKKITLHSSLFEYLLKKLNSVNSNFLIQKSKKINTVLSSNWQTKLGDLNVNKKTHILKKLNFSTYYLKKKESLLSLATQKKIKNLFFNVLFNEIRLKLQHSILIKNAKLIFLCFNISDIKNNISNFFRTNLTVLKPNNFHLSSLPTCIWYKNEIIILKKQSTQIYECLNILKKILYLYGFLSEYNQIKIGHTLFFYNKHSPGLNFLGFFICQYNYETNMNLQLNTISLLDPKQKLYIPAYLFSKEVKSKLETRNEPNVCLNRNLIFFKSQMNTLINLESKHQVHQLSNKFIITTLQPSKTEIKFYVEKLKKIIKNSNAVSQESLIIKLSHNIRIWAYYYKIISNKKILQYCDYLLFKMLWRWSCRRHSNKNKKWIKYKYFHKINGNTWVFGIYKTTTSDLICLPNHRDIK